MKMAWLRCDLGVLIILFLTCCRSTASGTALTFDLPETEKVCFTEKFRDTASKLLVYKVLRGGNNDINVEILSPNGKVVYSAERKTEDKVLFYSSFGEYQVCFDNEFSTFSHKVVYFDLRKEEIDNLAVEAGNNVPTVKTAAETSCDNIHEVMTMVVDYQRDYRLKEVMGRYLGEVVNSGVMWWSVGQTIIVMVIGFGQVFILKTFFTERASKTAI